MMLIPGLFTQSINMSYTQGQKMLKINIACYLVKRIQEQKYQSWYSIHPFCPFSLKKHKSYVSQSFPFYTT